MSEAVTPAARESLAPAFVSGVLSGLLYGTAVLGFAFLAPVQVIFGRRGRKAGIIAALVSLVVAGLVQFGQVALGGSFEIEFFGRLNLSIFILVAVVPPAVFLAALVLMNMPFWGQGRQWAADFAGTALVSAAALPALAFLARNAAFMQRLEGEIGRVVNSWASRAAGLASGAASGAVSPSDAGLLLSAADIHELAAFSFTVLQSSFVPLILVFLAASRWIGNRMSGPGSLGRSEARPVSEYRLPYILVWPFLAAWTGVLLVSRFKVGMPWSALAWNLAIAISLAYTVQGIGIASHFLRRWNMPKGLRLCVAATAVVLLLQPPVGTALVAILPILGVTEVWIPYRNPKGVGA